MAEIVSVKFRETGKAYSFDTNGMDLKVNDGVIVETSRGIEFGIVSEGKHEVAEDDVVAPLRKVIRLATDNDRRIAEENRIKEKKAVDICQTKVAEHKLEMKCIDVEYAFDGTKIIFYFTADGRVDFRELVKDLAGVFKTRIELRQVGVRDEAKLLGGLGICGRPFCCASFLDDFQPVSIKMAKEQNLSLNPTKISGTCGRLMCCLKYEQEAYEDLIKTTPKVSTVVETPQGTGTVVEVSLLTGKLKVRMDDSTDLAPKTFNKCEVCVKGGGGCRCVAEQKQEEADDSELAALEELEADVNKAPAKKSAFKNENKDKPKNKNFGERKHRSGNAPNGEKKPTGEEKMVDAKAEAGEVKNANAPAPKKPGGDRKPNYNRNRYHRNRRPSGNKDGNGGAAPAEKSEK